MPGFQSTRLATEGALEPFFFLYTDDSIHGNPETCKRSSIMLNYEVKNSRYFEYSNELAAYDLMVIDDFGLMDLDIEKCRDHLLAELASR